MEEENDMDVANKLDDQMALIMNDDVKEELKTDDEISPAKKFKEDTACVKKEGNCYCAKERNLNIVELLCAKCSRWYHESCIGYQLGKLVPFMMNYVFLCKNCSLTSLENFKKNQAPFPQMCVTAIANLMQQSIKEGSPRTMFSKDREIIPYIDCYWESMTTMPRRVTQSWHSTIQKALVKDLDSLFVCEEAPSEGQESTANYPLFGLSMPNLHMIKPNYEAMIRGGSLNISGGSIQHVSVNNALKGRNAKRRTDTQGLGMGKKRGDLGSIKLPTHGYPLEHPYNKDGYRYILAEPDPHAPFRQEFDESSDWAGKPIPGWLYRTLNPSTVLLALHDRAPQIRVSESRLAATGEKGYCMVRATHQVSRGCWFWEACITEMQEGASCRLGWGQEYANLQTPLGYDKFGYSWRSHKGTTFHESRGRHYSEGYGLGDVLGFLIILPEKEGMSYIPPTYKERPLVKFKSHLYYEEKDNVSDCLKSLTSLPGSKIIFFKNGECKGVAFSDIFVGGYYPTLSLFHNIVVTINMGPEFRHPPKGYKVRAMCERAQETMIEQAMSDMLYLTINDGKLRLDTYYS